MGEHYSHLSLAERRRIDEMFQASIPVREIAARLGRHHGTIHREINRNFYHTSFRDRFGNDYRGYFCMTANAMAKRRRRSGRVKLLRHPALLAHVVAKLHSGWSPQQVSGRLKIEPEQVGRISHESIYRHIYSAEGREAKLYALLAVARRHRRRQKGRKPRTSVIPAERWIEARPTEIGDRSQFGHWEADLVIFARKHGKANVTSLQERQTRYLLLLGNEDRRSADVMSRITNALAPLPSSARRSITFDRGTEFVGAWRSLSMPSWFCDPHSPWQKGGIENANGRVRRRLPLDSPVEDRSSTRLKAIATKMNDTPRKCLGWQTPAEAFSSKLAAIRRTDYTELQPSRT